MEWNLWCAPVGTLQSISSCVTTMPLSFQVSGADKDQLVTSLATLLLHDSGLEKSAENIGKVVQESGNEVPAYYPTLFAAYIEKAGGIDKFLAGPSAGVAGEFSIRLLLFHLLKKDDICL